MLFTGRARRTSMRCRGDFAISVEFLSRIHMEITRGVGAARSSADMGSRTGAPVLSKTHLRGRGRTAVIL